MSEKLFDGGNTLIASFRQLRKTCLKKFVQRELAGTDVEFYGKKEIKWHHGLYSGRIILLWTCRGRYSPNSCLATAVSHGLSQASAAISTRWAFTLKTIHELSSQYSSSVVEKVN